MNKKIQSTIFLTLTAMIWGFAFVAQRSGMDHIGPFLFSGLRMLLGSLALIPIILITEKFSGAKKESLKRMDSGSDSENESGSDSGNKHENGKESETDEISSLKENQNTFLTLDYEESTLLARQQSRKDLLRGGFACGFIVFFAANFQQVGLVFTTAAKTGFITTLYIVLVPLSGLFLKHKVGLNAWIGVAVATFGLYFLCITEKLTISFGDFVVLIGAGFWAAHILCMDHYAPKVSVPKLICLQFLVSGVLSLAISFFREEITWTSIVQATPALLYVGIFSSAIAFTFQGLGQKHASPTAASIILSTEAVFGALGGVIVLQEVLSSREWLGCLLMFVAVVITQLPSRLSKA